MTKKEICESTKQAIIERIRNAEATAASEGHRLGIPSSTIRGWIRRTKEAEIRAKLEALQEKQKIEDGAPPPPKHAFLLPQREETPTATPAPVATPDGLARTQRPDILEQFKMAAIDGFTCSADGMKRLREKAPTALNHIVDTLIAAIAQVKIDLAEGKTWKHAVFQGDMTEHRVNMTVADKAAMVNMLRQLTEQFTRLAVLPYGSVDPSKFVTEKESVASQHIHLHGHGSISHKPLTKKIQGSVQTEASPVIIETTDNLEDWQKDLLS